jgi:uncharacterized protein (TIGR02118 family)
MFKAVILLTRAEGVTHEQFCAWWLGEHADLARDLPGLRRLVFNSVESEDAPHDGISELWFDSREAFEAAYASDHGKAVAADSIDNVSGRVRLYVEEHSIVDER